MEIVANFCRLYYNIDILDKLAEKNGVKFLELKKHIIERKIKPCYLVTGDDAFMVKKATEMFAKLAGNYSDLNVTRYKSDASLTEVVSSLNSLPFLADYRVVFLENYSAKLDLIKDYIDSPNPTSVLVIVGSITSNLSPIIPKIETVDCNRLDETYLVNWVGSTINKGGCVTTKDAAALIVNYCNRDMNRISSEVDKLVSYCNGKPVTVEIVDALVSPDLEFKVFELGEAIANKKNDSAIKLIDKMLQDNNAPIAVFGLIFQHFRRLLYISLNPQSDTLASDLKVKEYAVKMAMKQASKYSPKRLKTIVDKLNALDVTIKGNSTYAKTAITAFVCETVLIG